MNKGFIFSWIYVFRTLVDGLSLPYPLPNPTKSFSPVHSSKKPPSWSLFNTVMDQITQLIDKIIANDWSVSGTKELQEALTNLKLRCEQLPLNIRSDILRVTHLLGSIIEDNSAMWSEICEMKGALTTATDVISNLNSEGIELKEKVKMLEEELKNVKTKMEQLQATADAMSMRQLSFAVQEKILREVGGSRIKELWTFYISTLEDLSKCIKDGRFPKYFKDNWTRVSRKYGITHDLKTLHRIIKMTSHHGTNVVHDTGFPHHTYEEMGKLIEQKVPPEDRQAQAWKEILEINKTLSDARKEDMCSVHILIV